MATYSTITSPVAKVREICSTMVGARRKDLVAACTVAGININTARTQVQRYLKAAKGGAIVAKGQLSLDFTNPVDMAYGAYI